MAFWALGAFDKMKNITEKLNIKDVSKKVISYVVKLCLYRLLKMKRNNNLKLFLPSIEQALSKRTLPKHNAKRYLRLNKEWRYS